MSFTSIPGGWRDRAKKVREAQERRDQAAEIRAERARMAEEHRALSERQMAEAEAARAVARVSCPCCDAGHVTVDFAERIYRALERLPSHSKPDPAVLEHLFAIAQGVTPPAASRRPYLTVQVSRPRTVEQAAARAETADPITHVTGPAPATKGKVKPSPELEFTADGALIEP
ncbi:hypothetical protein [Methylobacterium oxalidis]|uniref:Uncharacterized protein n=1 Tax=Methylobacterium oxalidis TaxID=944322 RepID=A0A512J137_9HYPH|nr:hypothetical protein [Methylobacterium oxalidis]GEP03690.1 hypothetical protein MOX02_17280 [Methylobacterium oxalidis]GJE33703.1 hypothetical protein LDDCCGHA_3906 [Methylobacterium oxalidis]GLS62275.1 hypothetical protein GCM10007888_06560 [Methylobacterium oxalidis]